MNTFTSNNFYENLIPLKISSYSVTNNNVVDSFWHQDIEILFCLYGSVDVHIENAVYSLLEEDIILINSTDSHSLSGNNGCVLSFRFTPKRLPYISDIETNRFKLNSVGNTSSTKYNYIRHLLAQLVNITNSGEHIYKAISIIFSIYGHLCENFLAPPLSNPPVGKKNREKLISIIDYIEKNYDKCLTLNSVAANFSYSAPYFASFFEKNTGKTFLTYYNEIRLSHAVSMLLSTNDSIEEIALTNGFNDVRSFVALFKKKYDIVPSKYRKANSSTYNVSEGEPQKVDLTDDIIKDDRDAVAKAIATPCFMKYLTLYTHESTPINFVSDNIKGIDAGTIDYLTESVILKHNFKKLMCVGSARQFLYSEVQDMLRLTQKEIGYKYVKFHGIFSDEMMVYAEDSDGNPTYSFALIDKVLDFLQSINLKPFCELSFMPIAMAKNPERFMDFYHFNTSPPKKLEKWTGLVTEFIKHVISRYGEAEVESWLFTVWNEPDDTVAEFAFPDKNEFFEFYSATYNSVKEINDNLKVGTPSLLASVTSFDGWSKDFFLYCNEHNTIPDFLNIHYYDNTIFDEDTRQRSEQSAFSSKNLGTFFPLTDDQYAFTKFINILNSITRRFNMKNIPVYLSEWNLTISHRDLINDTCFKACYLTKNLLENYDRLESFGYWVLTDFIEELQLPNELYHGGLGMFTYNGIPKAHYNAFKFINNLKRRLVAQGDGYFITKENNVYSIIIYNYEHYSKLFASGYRSEADLTNRYASFTLMNAAQFTLRLTNIDPKYTRVLIKERFINQAHGSSFDAWMKIGAQPLSRDEDFEILREQSQPGVLLRQGEIINNEFLLQSQLSPLEVRIIEMTMD